MTFSSVLIAIGFNLFLVPHKLISGGMSGIALMISYLSGASVSWMYFLLNFPVLVWGWFAIGRSFIFWSIYSVLTATLFLYLIPKHPLVDDTLLAAVFGGIIAGAGSGLALRSGGSTGGFDIIAYIVTLKRDWPVGMIIFTLNSCIITALIIFEKDWSLALYSLLSIYCSGKVIDLLYVRHIKMTAFIITTKSDAIIEQLLSHPRGITIIKTKGAYSSTERDMLMTVRTKYELRQLFQTVTSIDPKAFINIVETVGVVGDFRKDKQ